MSPCNRLTISVLAIACWMALLALPAGGMAFTVLPQVEAAPCNDVPGSGQMRYAWLFLGLYVLLGLGCGAFDAHRALARGGAPMRWFAVGFFLNLAAAAWILIRPPRRTTPMPLPPGLQKPHLTPNPASCPHCGRTNHPSARRCIACGVDLDPRVTSDVQRAEGGTQ